MFNEVTGRVFIVFGAPAGGRVDFRIKGHHALFIIRLMVSVVLKRDLKPLYKQANGNIDDFTFNDIKISLSWRSAAFLIKHS